ncbi:MAG: TonB family protein [Myxococcota bacterium]
MNRRRWLRGACALGFGVMLTYGQLRLIASLNDTRIATRTQATTTTATEDLRPLPLQAPAPRPPPEEPASSDPSRDAQPETAARQRATETQETSVPRPDAIAGARSDLPSLAPARFGSWDLGVLLPARSPAAGNDGADGRGRGSQGDADRPARPARRPPPVYPPAAQRQRVEGFVTLRLRVEDDGSVSDVVVVEASPRGVFERAATAAARRYRFEPAIVDGRPAATTVEQRVAFRLR